MGTTRRDHSVERALARLSGSDDPKVAAAARSLLRRVRPAEVNRAIFAQFATPRTRSDLRDVFEAFGNPVAGEGERLTCGHEPVHGSASGACVRIWPEQSRWWCFSCNKGGDALDAVRLATGYSTAKARLWLKGRTPDAG